MRKSIHRAAVLLSAGLLLFLFCQCETEARPESRIQTLKEACEFLWSKQAPDGGWHSETHGILKSGESITPFILHGLMQIPDSIYVTDRQKKEDAIAFVRNNLEERWRSDSIPLVLDYPTYSAAYSLRVLIENSSPEDNALISLIRQHLLREQFTEERY